MTILYSLISGLMFKIRGGLRVYGKKLPLCKWWFARKVKDDGKSGWHYSEIAYGCYLGVMRCLIG